MDRYSTLQVVASLIENIRYLRQNSHTRLQGYSTKFLQDVREELRGFTDELNKLINRQQSEQTGDLRPLIEDVRKVQR